MSSMYHRLRHRPVVAVAAMAGLVLAAAACSSNSSANNAASGSGGKVTISIDCAPPAAQQPVQHKEWIADIAIFEKANPNITINSVYNYPCDAVPAQFTAMLRAGTETNLYYAYFTDLPQVLLAGQAANITQYVNTKTVPNLNDIDAGSMKAVTAGKTLYGLPTSNYTQGLIYNRKLFPRGRAQPRPAADHLGAGRDGRHRHRQARPRHRGLGRLQRGQQRRLALLLVHRRSRRLDGQQLGLSGDGGFNTPEARQILQALHTMRFTDKR